ncbi:MAG: phosphatase PAP2 family protein [Acidobacteriia bacterium]|nr:phosphatase PAP2 family protein [Terriglobia bacterium]
MNLPRLNSVDWMYLVYLLAMALLAVLRRPPGAAALILLAHGLIATAIVGLAAWRERSAVVRFLHDWYPLAMFIFSFEEVARFALSISPHWHNDVLVRMEESVFGVSPNEWIGRFRSPWLSEVLDAGYFSYYPMFPVAGGLLYARKDKTLFRELMLTSVVMYGMAFLVYLLFPTQSPLHAANSASAAIKGGAFTWLVGLVQRHAGVHGNAFPSSHVALAVLCVVFAWRHARKAGLALLPFLVLISVSSIYDGYHYLSDVVAGILVALTALGLARLMSRRLANLFSDI